VQADLNDPNSLPPALTGATAFFVTTDFWGPFYNPKTLSLLKDNQSLGEYCYNQEFQQGKNIFDAAALVPTIERIVVSSLVEANERSGGKYQGVYHWDGKARALKYLRDTHAELAGKLSVVVMGNYMGNWLKELKLRKVFIAVP
jgi:hypothetical protein